VKASAAARSISRPVREGLRRTPAPPLHVLAAFERACDLVSFEEGAPGDVIALVTPEIGNGPLNIVVDEGAWDLSTIEPGMRVQADGERVQVGGLTVDLSEAVVWEPRPDWTVLRTHRDGVAAQLPTLSAFCLEHDRGKSLLALLGEGFREDRPREVVLGAAQSGLDALELGWGGNPAQLREGAGQLAGLGGGLTPAGDDLLCGAMLWAWAAHPRPASLCRVIAETAAPRTTTLSAAFLQAAAQGECGAAWHALFYALAQGDDASVVLAARNVLAQGATSGADALAGFLWAGTRIRQS